MAKPNFTSPGKESFWVDNKKYDCIVYAEDNGLFGARVEQDGRVLAQTFLRFGSVSDAWAWAVGALANRVGCLNGR